MNLVRFYNIVIHFTLLSFSTLKATNNVRNSTKQLASELAKKCLWLLENKSSNEEVKPMLNIKEVLHMHRDEFCEKYPIWEYKMTVFKEAVSYVISLLENTTNLHAAEMNKEKKKFASNKNSTVTMNDTIKFNEQVEQLMNLIDTLNIPRQQFSQVYPYLQNNLRTLFVKTAHTSLSLFYDRIISQESKKEEKNEMPITRLSKLFRICVCLLQNMPSDGEVTQLMNIIQNATITVERFHNEYPNLKIAFEQLITMIDVALSLMNIPVKDNNDIAIPITTPKYDHNLAKKVKEMRQQWKWMFENKHSEKEIQRLTNILNKLNMTTFEFIRILPKIRYQISDEVYENFKKSKFKDTFNRDEIIRAIKSPDYLIKDESRLTGMLALLRMPEGDLHQSDEEWVRNLGDDDS